MAIQMTKLIHSLSTTDVTIYWPNFQKVAYAVYDDKSVYVFNHPNFPESPFVCLPWSEAFMGNTLILFQDYPTAIVHWDSCPDDATIYAVLVHEMFHGHQHVLGETRFPDELKGITYPLLADNAERRNRERFHLYHAVMETDSTARAAHLRQFILQREARAGRIEDFISYELLTETVEGPAWYVELKAFADQSGLPFNEAIQQYGESLLDKEESVRHVRRSCYSSGLFICLLLDQLCPDWQVAFMETDRSLYSFFLQFVDVENSEVEAVQITEETVATLECIREERAEALLEVERQAPVVLTIHGSIRITGIDPMNIIAGEKVALHKHFLRIFINEQEYLFQQPVIAEYVDHLFDCHQLKIMLNEQPEMLEHGVVIKGVGKFIGRFDEENLTLSIP
ncbi:hypothetical protein [Sporosarcina sp. Te-1]|uniref:hypothetical protein n=1 Tax=Sporosarcina sp. Te-1 TaxID=2818390 RepID=UPI001A9DFF7D|nr:hypothetical protein [Sporosarcina sp. Te-1]QTD39938.1 hypothetical protein J3U78_14005 [Sporosarcina sp. Te-1]